MTKIYLKRAYDPVSETDGKRILVDRLWPRGKKKADLVLDYWAKEITPSTEIRKEFNHDAARFVWFEEVYTKELLANPDLPLFIEKIKSWLEKDNVTFIYGAKSPDINHAVILKKVIESIILEQNKNE